MIKKFNQYIKESHLDVDPFGEEDWEEETKFIILPKFKKFIEDNIPHFQQKTWMNNIGKIVYIMDETFIEGEDCYVVDVSGDNYFGLIVPKNCVKKVE